MTRRGKKMLSLVLMGLALAVMVLLTVLMWPWFAALGDAQARAAFAERVQAAGVWGFLLMLGVQVAQIILAVIPGEPIEIMAGALYGVWGGLALCLLGILLGSCAVFLLVRRWGMKVVTLWVSEEKLRSFSFFQNAKRLEWTTFWLFFIPGTPKDALTYVAGLTPIRPWVFLGIATVARIPSVITSVWAGASLSQGNWLQSALFFVAAGMLALIGLGIDRAWTRRRNNG